MRHTYLLLLAVLLCTNSLPVSIFYCGFGGDFCGQSTTDDVNPNVKFVILAFVNPQYDGTILVDDANFPHALVANWQASGKKVLLSVGGQNGNWAFVFSTPSCISNFINSMAAALVNYGLDGVDLDIESYSATPRTVAETIISLRTAIGPNKLIVVSPEDVAVIQSVSFVPTPDTPGQPWNYFVPIVNLADSAIDFYQPQAYNNGYDSYAGGSVGYLQDVYLNWRNIAPAGSIVGYNGIKGEKLLIGLEASTSAGGSSFYATPDVVRQFKSWLATNNYPIEGFMIWDSHWDTLNGQVISSACA